MLQKAVYPACTLYNVGFLILVENEEFQHCKACAASIDFMLANTPYNIRCVPDDENSSHNNLASDDLNAKSMLCSDLLDPGALLPIFCQW